MPPGIKAFATQELADGQLELKVLFNHSRKRLAVIPMTDTSSAKRWPTKSTSVIIDQITIAFPVIKADDIIDPIFRSRLTTGVHHRSKHQSPLLEHTLCMNTLRSSDLCPQSAFRLRRLWRKHSKRQRFGADEKSYCRLYASFIIRAAQPAVGPPPSRNPNARLAFHSYCQVTGKHVQTGQASSTTGSSSSPIAREGTLGRSPDAFKSLTRCWPSVSPWSVHVAVVDGLDRLRSILALRRCRFCSRRSRFDVTRFRLRR